MGTYRFDAQVIQPIDEKLFNTWPLIFHELKHFWEFFTPVQRGGLSLRLGQLGLEILFKSRMGSPGLSSFPLWGFSACFFSSVVLLSESSEDELLDDCQDSLYIMYVLLFR